jgi:hypothetical protein
MNKSVFVCTVVNRNIIEEVKHVASSLSRAEIYMHQTMTPHERYIFEYGLNDCWSTQPLHVWIVTDTLEQVH